MYLITVLVSKRRTENVVGREVLSDEDRVAFASNVLASVWMVYTELVVILNIDHIVEDVI